MSASAKNKGGKRRSAEWPAAYSVLPSLAAPVTGPRSQVEHSVSEQYLDRAKAGKIAPSKGQARNSGKANTAKPHSEALDAKAKRAAPLQSDSPPASSKSNQLKAGPTQGREVLVGGRAGRARSTPPGMGLLCEYNPISWHHEKGILKVVRRLLPRLPDVSGSLFLTFTLDHNLFNGPASAFEFARQKIRKLNARLRKGVKWQGKFYQTDAPYCVKVEFHADEDGWPHFHVIQLTRRFLPGGLLNHLWGLGRVNVKRISNDDFHYMLKYATKGIGYPEWVLSRHRIRIFQSSRGFLKAQEASRERVSNSILQAKKKRASYTIRERLERYSRTALLQINGRYQTILLGSPYQQLFDELIHAISEDSRYLGLGLIKINKKADLYLWKIKTPI